MRAVCSEMADGGMSRAVTRRNTGSPASLIDTSPRQEGNLSSFASERWVKVVRRPASEGPPTNRRYLEVCVFSYLAGS